MTNKQKLSQVLIIVGKQGAFWLLLGVTASLVVGFVEYGIALFMQLLMLNLDLIPLDNFPEKMRFLSSLNIQATCLMLVLIGILRSVGHFVSQQGAHFFSNIVNTRLRMMTLFEMLLDKRHRFIPASEINMRFAEIFPKAGLFVSSITSLTVAGIQLALMFSGMLYLAWRETIIGILGIAFFGIFLKAFQRAILHSSQQVVIEQENILKGVERVSRNWLFIRIANTRIYEYNKMLNQFLRQFNFYMRAGLFTKTSANLPQLFGTLLLASLIFISKSHFNTSGANLLGFLYLYIRFLSNISGFVDSLGNLVTVYPYFIRAIKIVSEMSPVDVETALTPVHAMKMFKPYAQDEQFFKPSRIAHADDSVHSIPSLTFENLTFQWPNQEQALINLLNLKVNSCEVLGIVGPSGCGKSTLLLLLLGVIAPLKGKILVGSRSAEKFLEDCASDIGYVGADPFLIPGSIRENLLYGLDDQVLSDEKLWNSLRKAQLSETIIEKGGLTYCINENGDGLSSGQKQRLAIARALLRCPKLMVLDEATANLDSRTEEEIALMLKGLSSECTMVIVSHREGLLKYVDRKLQFQNGSLITGN